jgi:hypothetical protein
VRAAPLGAALPVFAAALAGAHTFALCIVE